MAQPITTASSSPYSYEEYNVLDIHLDPENPRHDPIEFQAGIIAYLLREEKVRNMARDIAAVGISPIELMAVFRDSSENLVVYEGNRRLCALILLNDPESAPESERKYYQNLAKNSSVIPTRVRCVEFKNKHDADIWIERRHEGEQDGVGVRPWNANQIARHQKAKDKPSENAMALSVIDYAVKHGLLPASSSKNILTTVTRYLGTPYFRRTIGIVSGRSDSDVVIDVSYVDFDRVLAEFLKDLRTRDSRVSSRTDAQERESYADALIRDGFAPTTKTDRRKLKDRQTGIPGSGTSVGSKVETSGLGITDKGSSEDDASPDASNQTRKKVSRKPDARQYIIPSDFRPPVGDKILRRVLEEIKSINADTLTLAASMVTRAFLENVYKEYVGAKVGYMNAETHLVLKKAISLIEASGGLNKAETKALGALTRVQANETNPMSPKSLGANAHGNHYPNGTELKREWDNISAIIERMLVELYG